MRRVTRGVLTLCLIGMGVACVPPEPELDLSKDYSEDTVMGEIQERGHIVIAIADDAHPLGYVDQSDQAQGFTAELGRFMAEQLGVEPRFITGSSNQIVELPENGTADIAFPALTITEPLVRKFQLSDPYYVAHQRQLVRTGEDAADLVTYCATGNEETLVTPPGEGVTTVFQEPLECLRLLLGDTVDAVTAPDYLLAGLRAGRPGRLEVVDEQWTTEGLGAVIEKGAAAWTDYVNGVFVLAKQEGVWQEAFEATIGGPLGLEVEPPSITAEEAAALYPSETL
jgi:glutamate transport system substrate-binding protein